jgi:hypothetical protein
MFYVILAAAVWVGDMLDFNLEFKGMTNIELE